MSVIVNMFRCCEFLTNATS